MLQGCRSSSAAGCREGCIALGTVRRIGPKSADAERSKKNCSLFQIKDEATTSGWWLKRQYDLHSMTSHTERGTAKHSTQPC